MAIIDAVKTAFVVGLSGLFAWLVAHSIFYLPVEASKGQKTFIQVSQAFAANIDLHVMLAWGAAGGGAAWGFVERKKRKRERQERDARIAELENKIDPGRTSSGLDPSGNPQKQGSNT